jgi:hypothetical protein
MDTCSTSPLWGFGKFGGPCPPPDPEVPLPGPGGLRARIVDRMLTVYGPEPNVCVPVRS